MSKEENRKDGMTPLGEGREGEDFNVREVHGSMSGGKGDPRQDRNPGLLWLVAVFMSLIFWGGTYLAFYSGGFKSTEFDRTQMAWGGAVAAPEAKGPPDPMVLGKRVFTVNCVTCHQATGQGVPNAFPPLVGSEWVLGNDWHGDNHLVKILLHGLQGPIQVKGNTYNGAMPPWNMLKDEEIAAVLTYIRNEWGNSAPPITAEQVAKIRAETASQTQPYTQDELKKFPAVKFESAAPETPAPAAGEPAAAPADPAPAAPAPAGSPVEAAPAAAPVAPTAQPSPAAVGV